MQFQISVIVGHKEGLPTVIVDYFYELAYNHFSMFVVRVYSEYYSTIIFPVCNIVTGGRPSSLCLLLNFDDSILYPCNPAERELLQGVLGIFPAADFYEFFQPSALASECGGQIAKFAHGVSPPDQHYTTHPMSKMVEFCGGWQELTEKGYPAIVVRG
jgi:hypothetical protein